MNKKHIVYKITNLHNEMIYIGKHSTTTPYGMKYYWGSSEYLDNAIKKYGKKNFKRETLFVFDTEDEAYAREEEIVTPEFVAREDTYNFKEGGLGGSKGGKKHPQYGVPRSPEEKSKIQIGICKYWNSPEGEKAKQKVKEFHTGRHHTEETCNRIRESRIGKSSAFKLSPEIIKQRREDIKNIPKTWGWKTRLSEQWEVHWTTAGTFIKKYASDLI